MIYKPKLGMNRGIFRRMGGSGKAIVAAPAYPDILFYWGMESTTAEYSAGDSSATSSGTISTDQYAAGAKSLYCTGVDQRADFDVSAYDIIPEAEGQVGIYIRVVTFADYGGIFASEYTSSDKIYLKMSASGKLSFIYYGTVSASPEYVDHQSVLSVDTWYFVVAKWSVSKALTGGKSQMLSVYDTAGAEVGSTVSSANTLGGFAGALPSIKIGNSGYASTAYFDQIFISDDITRDLVALRASTTAHP